MSQALETLFLFLEREPSFLSKAEKILFLRGEYHPGLTSLKGRALSVIQTFRSSYDRLKAAGLNVKTELEEKGDLILFLPSRFRNENLYLLAKAWECLNEGGTLICAMSNDLGASRYEKHLGDLTGSVETWSKNKCRVFWAQKGNAINSELSVEWLALGELQSIPGTVLKAYPGSFSARQIDQGSAFLVEHLPSFYGRGADLGAGYGYLSWHILQNGKDLKALYLYEAEYNSLKAAEHNLASFVPNHELKFLWHDLSYGIDASGLDWVVTNPPFHSGREEERGLAESFIVAAAGALRLGGELFLVANAHLNYEGTIGTHFRKLEKVAANNHYKIIRACR